MQDKVRIDVNNQGAEELALARHHAQLVFRFNHTMPFTEEYTNLMREFFPQMGESIVVYAPLTAVRPHMVKIGKNVTVMNGSLMMSPEEYKSRMELWWMPMCS